MDMPKLNDAKIEIQLGLVGLVVIIGLVAAMLWFVVENAPFEMKMDSDKVVSDIRSQIKTDEQLQAQVNSQLVNTLHDVSNTQADLQSRIADLQDDEIQVQQWLMDNQTAAHPYTPRQSARLRRQ